MTRGRLALAAGAAIAAALLVWVAHARLPLIHAALGRFHGGWAAAAAACALLSHAMAGLALSAVLRQLGHPLGGPAVLGIALVSTTANYAVSSAGVGGFALKAYLLHKRRVPVATTIAAAAVTSAIFYAVLAAIVALGTATLLFEGRGPGGGAFEALFGLATLIGVSGGLFALFLDGRLRTKATRVLFHWSNRAAFGLARREIPRESFLEFEKQMAHGFARIRHAHGTLGLAVLYTALDWGLALLSLWLCFRAVGESLPPGPLSAAFAAGQGATLVPILPGGLGAAEGAMTGLLESMGYDGGRVLVAALAFRAAYYLLPGALSVFVFWGLRVSEPELLDNAARSVPTSL